MSRIRYVRKKLRHSDMYSVSLSVLPTAKRVTAKGVSEQRLFTWSPCPIDSYPYCSILIGPSVPEIQLIQNLTLKIQSQGHGWGQRSQSKSESHILLNHIPLVPCQSALPFLRYSIFKIWHWKSKVKVIAQGHIVEISEISQGPMS